jgi:hypothetical protein
LYKLKHDLLTSNWKEHLTKWYMKTSNLHLKALKVFPLWRVQKPTRMARINVWIVILYGSWISLGHSQQFWPILWQFVCTQFCPTKLNNQCHC